MAIPRVLIIAGSDSSGGAGLEADQKVLAAHGVYACTATTALTAQNTLGVQDIHITPPAFVAKQIDAVLSDVGADVVKIGMLASAATVDVVADELAKAERMKLKIVLDPVMVSTSGHQLLPGDAVRSMRQRLIKGCDVVTPNIPEAILLVRETESESGDDGQVGDLKKFKSPQDLEELKNLARLVHRTLEPKAVLLKGGHIPLCKTRGYVKATKEEEKELVVDVLYEGNDKFEIIESKYFRSRNTHGTGCSLASAIAANLSLNLNLSTAIKRACQYVGTGIELSIDDIGAGSGPINHFHNIQRLPFSRGHFIEYLLARTNVKSVWYAYTHHKFVEQMGDGTLPTELFKEYLIQDYLYLTHFARTNALAAYKSTRMDKIATSAQIVLHIEREMALHLDYCREFGLSKKDIEMHKESQACVAYSRYVLDIGQSQDWLALQMSLLPCLLGYGMAAKRLDAAESSKRDENMYWKWVQNYVADDYRDAVSKGSNLIEENIVLQSPSRIEELIDIFIRATEMEIQFWEFGAHRL